MDPKKSPNSQAGKLETVPLSRLHLDSRNPRLGGQGEALRSEIALLDKVVEEFGVDDVLSSIAVNGYFDAEPVIGVKNPDKGDEIIIKEGNRRLAACLILSGDPRAKNQAKRTKEYRAILEEHKTPEIEGIPVLVYEDKDEKESKQLLSYLGVRHIAASQPWDSYAKAAWVASVLEEGQLTLDGVSLMIGDQNRTVARLVEGYYFIKQLNDTSRFNPRDSQRSGRGSNPDFPFSWVYTVLGYKSVRNWLELEDFKGLQNSSPIKKEKLDDAADLVMFVFGNKTKNRMPVISDSREIAGLAVAVSEPERRELLRQGKTVSEVIELSRSRIDRITSGLIEAQDSLHRTLIPLSEGDITDKQAASLVEPSKKVRSLATDIHNRLVHVAFGIQVESDG